MKIRSQHFFDWMNTPTTVRDFSDKKIPEVVNENIICSAYTSPSGAQKQPWTLCVVKNSEIKKQISLVGEQKVKESYIGRMPD